jgi:hypothetical protein
MLNYTYFNSFYYNFRTFFQKMLVGFFNWHLFEPFKPSVGFLNKCLNSSKNDPI